MKKFTTTLAVMAAIASGSAQALVIDTFDSTGSFTVSSTGSPVNNTAVGTSSSGYARDLSITSSGDKTEIQIDTGTNPGVFAHSQGSGVTGTSTLNYNLGGTVDLTAGNTQNAFRIRLASFDLNGLFGISINGGTPVMLNTTSVFLQNSGVLPSYADILFSAIAGDEATATSVQLHVNGSGQSALDMSIDSLSTVCSSLSTSGGSGANPSGNLGTCPPPPPGAPEIDAISGTGALTLMAGALALVSERRRRRS